MAQYFSIVAFLALLIISFAEAQDLRNRVTLCPPYPLEYHNVTTPDGYVLGMYRFPGSPLSPVNSSAPPKTVVFVMHGLACSWADWVVLGCGKAIPYLLADAGYDVWLGNARGNTFSRNHVNLSASDDEFWDFSWHQIGIYDLPTMINYALSYTGQKDLHYIGHSQGTTTFFVMASMLPQMNSVIRTMHAFAPVAFMSHLISPFYRLASLFVFDLYLVAELFGVGEFEPSSALMEEGGLIACQCRLVCELVCKNYLFLVAGFDSPQLNCSIVPEIYRNNPAGSSVDQFLHYGQEISSGYFRQFDYGSDFENIKRYGTTSPPNYNLEAITAKVFLYYSLNDWEAAVVDVEQLASLLPNNQLLQILNGNIWILSMDLIQSRCCTITP